VGSTISIGVSSFSKEFKSSDEIMAQADKMLYKSKRNGKNATSH